MFCEQCGVKNQDNAPYCTSCGAELNNTVAPKNDLPFDAEITQQPIIQPSFVPDESSPEPTPEQPAAQQPAAEQPNPSRPPIQAQPPIPQPPRPPYSPQPPYQQPYQQPYQPPYPPQPPKPPVPGKGMSIAAMVLGIVACVFCCYFFFSLPCAITGLVLGCMGNSKAKRSGEKSGFAIAGIATSASALGIIVLFFVYYLLILGTVFATFGEVFDDDLYYAIRSIFKL